MTQQNGRCFFAAAIGRHGHDGPASLEFLVIVLGLVLGHTRTDECPDQADNAGSCRRVGKDDAKRSGGDGRANDRNDTGDHSQARERSQSEPRQSTSNRSRSGMPLATMGRGGGGVRGRAFIVSHGDANLVLSKSRLDQFADCLVSVVAVFKNTDDRGSYLCCGHESFSLLSSHGCQVSLAQKRDPLALQVANSMPPPSWFRSIHSAIENRSENDGRMP